MTSCTIYNIIQCRVLDFKLHVYLKLHNLFRFNRQNQERHSKRIPGNLTSTLFLIFSVISFIGIFVTFSDFKNKKRSKWIDFILLFITGLIGCVICFLWFFTDHSTAPNNFNFLWAFAPNLIIAFLMLKVHQKKWLKSYVRFSFFLLFIIPILWVLGVQLFPIAIIPFLILLLFRYAYLSKTLNQYITFHFLIKILDFFG